MKIIGTIKEIWRYPVKSMRGERLNQCVIGNKGVKGDRGWAVRDDTVNEIRGGRYLPGLLDCSARYQTEPKEEPYPAATITLPDGTEIPSNADDINQRLSDWIGKPVSIWPIQPADNTEHYRRLPLDEAKLREEFAREPDEPIPDLSQFPEILMKYVSVPGTYFDVTPIHLLTTSTLAFLHNKNPGSNWSTLRFRPNIVIDSGDAPTPRCAITIHSQGNLIPGDPKILRTIVKESDQNLGLYCNINKPGIIRKGEEVVLIE